MGGMGLTERIIALAKELGHVEESEGLTALCESAQVELTGMLREGVTAEDCGGAFPLAAAWLALAALQTGGSGDEVESFTAGAVSIRKKDGAQRAAALRLQAVQVMKPWLRDEGFVFRGVEG